MKIQVEAQLGLVGDDRGNASMWTWHPVLPGEYTPETAASLIGSYIDGHRVVEAKEAVPGRCYAEQPVFAPQ